MKFVDTHAHLAFEDFQATPASLRGQRNELVSVTILANHYAKFRRIQLSKVASQTTENTKFLFRL